MTRFKKKSIILSLLIMFTLSFIPYNKVEALDFSLLSNTEVKATSNNLYNSSVRPQDDFYDYVNGQWLKTAYGNINPLLRENSYISDLYIKSDKDVSNMFKDILNKSSQYSEDSDEKKMINLYNNVLNVQARNSQGITPIKKYLDKIEKVKDIKELSQIFSDPEMGIFNNLFRFNVIDDYTNNKTHELYITPTVLGLGSSDSYSIENDENEKNKDAYIKYLKNLLTLSGQDPYTADKKIKNLLEFEKMVSTSTLGLKNASENTIDKSKINVQITIKELNEAAPNINFTVIMKGLGIDNPNKIVVQQMEWLKNFNDIYTNDNLDLIKNYIEMTIYQSTTMFLTEDLYKANAEYLKYLGNEDYSSDTLEDRASYIINKKFTMTLGKLYTERYFTLAEKQDVENLTKEIIEVYKKRIENNNWIGDYTKSNAIKKLNKMSINIAYPENYENYSKVNIKAFKDGGSLLDNMMNLTLLSRKNEFKDLNNPIKKTIFSDDLPPQSVTAEYHFNINGIIISAGILQPDFYKITDSKERKLATIGFIIAHEVSHSLDDIGANYDEDGNQKQWWNPEDYKKFQEKTNKISQFYSKIEVNPNEYINGQLTLGENIADIGSMSCLLDILKETPNANYKEFFESYANGYRCARTPEYEEALLKFDTHSPYKYRVNAVLEQFDKFYETYGITENDKMYVKPEDRVGIW